MVGKNIYKILFVVVSFLISQNALAISGACSSHDGVNCSIGRQLNGKVYCNDGWTESLADYDFMAICKNQKSSCKIEQWNSLAKEYNLDGLYNQMQEVVDKMSINALSSTVDSGLANLLQTQYNILKSNYDSTYRGLVTQCNALGVIAGYDESLKEIETKQNYYDEQIRIREKAIAKTKEDQQKLLEDQAKRIEALNEQKVCPENSVIVGDKCRCDDGYIVNGSTCVTYTQSCQAKYGANTYGDKQYCHCSTGYEWNTSQTACINVEVKPVIIPPVTVPTEKSAAKQIVNLKKEDQKTVKPSAKLVIKDESTKESTLIAFTSEKENIQKEEIKNDKKPGFFVRVLGSVKNLLWSFFK